MKKQKVTWKVISASSEVACTHDKRLKQDADPQLCLPSERREHLYRSSIATGGAVTAWNAGWPRALLTVCRLWSLICSDPCNTRSATCNRATNTSTQLLLHINPPHYRVTITLMCSGGADTHTEAGRQVLWVSLELARRPFVTCRN